MSDKHMAHIHKLHILCDQMMNEIKRFKKEHSPHKSDRNLTYKGSQDIYDFLKDNSHILIDIEYNGGTKAGWRRTCTQIRLTKTHLTVRMGNKVRTFLLGKISQLRPSPIDIKKALSNYEQFHHMTKGSATIENIESSSAGLSGWVSYQPIQIPEQSTDDTISNEMNQKVIQDLAKFHLDVCDQ